MLSAQNSATWYRWEGHDLILTVRVQPRASHSELADVQADYLRVRLNVPPVDGKANAQLLKLLAATFGVPKSAVTLLQGQSARTKRLHIAAPRRLPSGIDPPDRRS